MRKFSDYRDDLASEGFDIICDSAYHCIDDCPESWAVGSDEIGNPVYCEAAVSDYLRRDVA